MLLSAATSEARCSMCAWCLSQLVCANCPSFLLGQPGLQVELMFCSVSRKKNGQFKQNGRRSMLTLLISVSCILGAVGWLCYRNVIRVVHQWHLTSTLPEPLLDWHTTGCSMRLALADPTLTA
jgi:hypothetical protein